METVAFDKDDILFAYTDGVSELMNSEGVQFGVEAIKGILQAHQNEDISILKEHILESIQSHHKDTTPNDDISFVCISSR